MATSYSGSYGNDQAVQSSKSHSGKQFKNTFQTQDKIRRQSALEAAPVRHHLLRPPSFSLTLYIKGLQCTPSFDPVNSLTELRGCSQSELKMNTRGPASRLKDSIPVTELSANGPSESHDLLRKGFPCVKNELLPTHPLELSEKISSSTKMK
ncbi:hypothetical protein QTO34_005156 [Cnephaeus nilssonii]|uniref:Uncharacterized protein n=1 Tax=Cnephaeus nilssonii TaxID=3371016 RepID=A0AA40LHU9_CNENI|nr:hypothetical protein QTO34_005156 [Eptesicus nilssonii]